MLYAQGQRRRAGSAVISLTALLSVALFGMVAFAVDIGYVAVARNELQNGADAGALAGAARLVGKSAQAGAFLDALYYRGDNEARREAQRFGQANRVGGDNLVLGLNVGNDPAGDIVIGYVDPNNPQGAMRFDLSPYNSVQVRARRDTSHGGALGLFFGRVLGTGAVDVTATARATLLGDPWGRLLPITMHVDDYRRLLDDKTDPGETDDYSFNPDLAPLSSGSYSNRVTGASNMAQADGVREFRLYPDKVTSAGNFGTLDLGILSGAVNDLRRQIQSGPSTADRSLMAAQGQLTNGRFVATEAAPVSVSGDTGISWTIEDNLGEIIGQSRTIPLHKTVNRVGTTASFSIVGFANVVVVYTNRSGGKEITVQPIAPFAILSSPDQNMLGKLILTR